MGILLTIVIIVFAGLWFFVKITRTVSITAEKSKAHNKCAYCRARLKRTADRMHFASVCPRCARAQPWVQPPEAA